MTHSPRFLVSALFVTIAGFGLVLLPAPDTCGIDMECTSIS